MYEVNQSKPVMVTGATGYVAGWIIKNLLEKGVTVHATVRDPSNKKKVQHLDEIAAKSEGEIQYFKTDLLDEGSFEEAMKGCSIVFHTASPFVLNVKDPQRDLVDPAKKGTQNVLNQANKTDSVERVVLTSSVVSMYGDNIDLKQLKNGTLTEEDWNTTSSLSHQAYSFSKTEAEKEAWKIAKSQNKWKLVVINPSFVMGPGVNPNATSESFHFIKQLGDGTMKAGVPKVGFGVVDVRDVAEAHISAAYTQDAEGRHITSGHNTSFLEMAQSLLPKYGNDYPIPKKSLPKALVWLFGPIADSSITRKFVSKNVGYDWIGDNSKSREKLGVQYRPLSETMNDFFQQMIDTKQIQAGR